jgi:hypothetical protein
MSKTLKFTYQEMLAFFKYMVLESLAVLGGSHLGTQFSDWFLVWFSHWDLIFLIFGENRAENQF